MNNLFGLVGNLIKFNYDNSTITIEVNNEVFEIIIPETIEQGFKKYSEKETIILVSGFIKNENNNYKLVATKISYVSDKIKRD